MPVTSSSNRVIYPQEIIFVGATGATSGQINQMYGVQSVGFTINPALEDVNELGNYGPVSKEQVQPVDVSFNFNYLIRNLRNESGLGFRVDGSAPIFTDIVTGLNKEQNYYLAEAPNQIEAISYTGDRFVVGVGNGVIASYTAQGAVGQFPTAAVTIQGLDANFSLTAINFDNPAIHPVTYQPVGGFVSLPNANTGIAGFPSVLKPGFITVNINGGGVGLSGLLAQSFSVNAGLNLQLQQTLGNPYGTREFQFPISADCSFDFIRKDFGTGRASNLRCGNGPFTLVVSLLRSTCDGSVGQTQAQYTLKGAYLDEESFSTSIGPASTVNMKFSAPVGGPNALNKGLYLSGSIV